MINCHGDDDGNDDFAVSLSATNIMIPTMAAGDLGGDLVVIWW